MVTGGRHGRADSVCFEDPSSYGSHLGKRWRSSGRASRLISRWHQGSDPEWCGKDQGVPRGEGSRGNVTVRLGHEAQHGALGAPGVGEEGAGLRDRRPRLDPGTL